MDVTPDAAVPRREWQPTGTQRELLVVMRERSPEVANRFEGALRAFADEGNPDGLAQSALSIREVFVNFGLVMRIEATRPTFNLKSEVANLAGEWRRMLRLSADAPLATAQLDAIPQQELTPFIRRFHRFLTKFEADKPQRAQMYETVVRASDPRSDLMPSELLRIRQSNFADLEGYVQSVLHHGKTPTRADFGAQLAACERLFWEMLRPPTREMQQEIDRILGR